MSSINAVGLAAAAERLANSAFHGEYFKREATVVEVSDLRLLLDALNNSSDREADWRVLGGVIPGPIPVEWVRVGDAIRDHGVTGTITRAVRSGGMVHLVIGSWHVSFAKVARQDFITVISTNNHENRSL